MSDVNFTQNDAEARREMMISLESAGASSGEACEIVDMAFHAAASAFEPVVRIVKSGSSDRICVTAFGVALSLIEGKCEAIGNKMMAEAVGDGTQYLQAAITVDVQ